MENLFDVRDASREEEVTRVLYQDGQTRIEKILSSGQASPDGFWYDQEEAEWVSVLQGEAELELETGRVLLRAGDSFLLPAHLRHRVARTSNPCIWLCVFSRDGAE